MFYTLVSRVPTIYKNKSNKKLLTIFIIGSVLYLFVHYYFYSDKKLAGFEKMKGYLHYFMILDFIIAFILISFFKSSPKEVEIDIEEEEEMKKDIQNDLKELMNMQSNVINKTHNEETKNINTAKNTESAESAESVESAESAKLAESTESNDDIRNNKENSSEKSPFYTKDELIEKKKKEKEHEKKKKKQKKITSSSQDKKSSISHKSHSSSNKKMSDTEIPNFEEK